MDRQNNKRKYNNKPRFNKKTQDNRKREKGPDYVVVYTSPEGPKTYADWQLKLMAMSDTFDKKDNEDYSKIVEARYQELWHKYNK